LNENTNGLIRDFFPKGTDFSTIANAEVAKVERLLNARPRKSLGFWQLESTLGEEDAHGYHPDAEEKRHDGVARFMTAKPLWLDHLHPLRS
jgi:hypothetical protein